MQKHINKQKILRRGTVLKEVRTLGFIYQNVNLPQLTTIPEDKSKGSGANAEDKEKLEQELTFDDLNLIRKQVSILRSFPDNSVDQFQLFLPVRLFIISKFDRSQGHWK